MSSNSSLVPGLEGDFPGTLTTAFDALDRIRTLQSMLEEISDLSVAGELEADDLEYLPDGLSHCALSYMTASVDHLGGLMDLLEPQLYSLTEAAGLPFTARPVKGHVHHIKSLLMLGRAGLESAAQALWLLEPDSSSVRMQRHFRLVVVDLQEEVSALGPEGPRDLLAATKKEGVSRYGTVPHIGYKTLVREAAELMGENPDLWERMWRGASAATHGRVWINYSAADIASDALVSIARAATHTLCTAFNLYRRRGDITLSRLRLDEFLDELIEANPDVWFVSAP